MLTCEMCGASLEGCHALRRFCDACRKERQNKRNVKHYRAKVIGIKEVRRCVECGAEVGPRRLYCDDCRVDRRKISTIPQAEQLRREMQADRDREPVRIPRVKDPLSGWSAVEIARLGRLWGLSYGHTVLKARDTPPGELEELREKIRREAL